MSPISPLYLGQRAAVTHLTHPASRSQAPPPARTRHSRAHLAFSALTHTSLFTLSTTPATEAISLSSSTKVPWPLRRESGYLRTARNRATPPPPPPPLRRWPHLMYPVSVVIVSPGATRCFSPPRGALESSGARTAGSLMVTAAILAAPHASSARHGGCGRERA